MKLFAIIVGAILTGAAIIALVAGTSQAVSHHAEMEAAMKQQSQSDQAEIDRLQKEEAQRQADDDAFNKEHGITNAPSADPNPGGGP